MSLCVLEYFPKNITENLFCPDRERTTVYTFALNSNIFPGSIDKSYIEAWTDSFTPRLDIQPYTESEFTTILSLRDRICFKCDHIFRKTEREKERKKKERKKERKKELLLTKWFWQYLELILLVEEKKDQWVG